MKGKKILFYSLMLSLLSVVAFCCVFNFDIKKDTIQYAKAEAIEGYSEKYEGDIIFSVEKVYFANDKSKQLNYNGYTFTSILDESNTASYFGSYKLLDGLNNKYVVKQGDYVIVDDMTKKSATLASDDTIQVEIEEGIMITLGGYFFDLDGDIKTTSVTQGEGGIDVYNGAGLELVSIQATLNGNKIELPSPRTYNSKYYDFVWFIPTDKSDGTNTNEGHYEISIAYMKSGQNVLHQTFDFYYLYQSSYEQEIEINEHNYTPKPTFENVSSVTRQYITYLGECNINKSYPLLTFDYSRYSMGYTYTNGGVEKEYVLEYDGTNLLLNTTIYGVTTTKTYPVPASTNNTIVSVMFTDAGDYTFKYKYVYNYIENNEVKRKQIDNLTIEDMKLTIHGYQLKYSKTDTLGVDMNYLEIASNGTMFILVNGFTENDSTKAISAGFNYKLITSNEKTGKVINSNNDKLINAGNAEIKLNSTLELKSISEEELNSISYQTTNQGGLWLTLNDTYYLKNGTGLQSYYYFSTQPITVDDLDNLQEFTKVTTFTKTGYYLVQVKYSYKDNEGADQYVTQWFAFRITSSTPKMNMYSTELEEYTSNIEDIENFYSHQFTNKNVYATWEEPNIFESKIIGTLYSSNTSAKYPTEEELKYVASGGINSNIKATNYTKNTIISNNGSYLLVLQLENTLTKTYSYFTIDKEDISGLEVYEVSTYYLNNKAVYSIKRDENLQYITYTQRALIDVDFTLGWADKASRANIYASYKFAPFVKTTVEGDREITDVLGENVKLYMLNDYVIGSMSQSITIEKPKLNTNLNVENVLTNQGIYIFTLQDEAGNVLYYAVIVDRTENYIEAWFTDDGEDNKNTYYSGEIINNDVNLKWGTHKAINISGIAGEADEVLQGLINGEEIKNYYDNTNNSNLDYFKNLFYTTGSKTLLTVSNSKAEIRLLQSNNQNVYIINGNGVKMIQYPSGAIIEGWDNVANTLFTNVDAMGITIKVDETEQRSYNINVVGLNQLYETNRRSTFKVVITPDKALGQVLSSSQEGEYETNVATKATSPTYDGEISDENLRMSNYNYAQASDDGLFVFECIPNDATFKVTEIRYSYYQLMSQSSLNALTKENLSNYPFYPYTYVSSSYILKTEGDVITTKDYEEINKVQNGKDVTVIRSNPINLGYETYYENGELISRRVTQTGLYIITRKIKQGEADEQEWSYAFFVDRNQIISYSINNNEKLVGEFIHANMPQETIFENFAKQGLLTKEQKYVTGTKDENGNNKVETISYKVYLETNKLPTQIKVPTGKYVSGNASKEIIKTSAENLKLKLSVYFYDCYGLLYAGSGKNFIRLMSNVEAQLDSQGNVINDDGYMLFNFQNLDNADEVAAYRKIVAHNSADGMLSVPGEYVFVISDTVGKVYDDLNNIIDCNVFTFGVRLTNVKPETDVYAYSNINGYKSDNKYSANNILYTNQEFVDFEIPKEVIGSYQAQIDFDNFQVYQISNGTKKLWLSKINGQISSNGIIKDSSRIIELDDRYVIQLDSGLTVENGVIINYQEYIYEIVIQYILVDSGTQYYTYNTSNGSESFYSSIYTVYIDRTPYYDNLNNILSSQKTYFEDYISSVVSENNLINESLNIEKAYRSNLTGVDYYALVNSAYYQLVEQGNSTKSALGMYAISINQKTKIDTSELQQIYYKKLDFTSEAENVQKMGLLPICDAYFTNSSGYHIFSENLTTYSASKRDATYYWDIVSDENETYLSGYYEIVEIDKAGNLTQYVVYFEPSSTLNAVLNVEGRDRNNEECVKTLNFKLEDIVSETFIGINNIEITNIATDNNPYYLNIKIYDGKGVAVTDIYVNSSVKQSDLNSQLANVLKTDGNYTLQIIDTYSKKYYLYINNYTNTNYQLTTSALVVKSDNYGNKYIQVGLANTQMNENASLYCYVSEITFEYNSLSSNNLVSFNGNIETGVFKLSGTSSSEVVLAGNDIIYLADNKQYLVTLKDSFGKDYYLIISTDENYQSYSIQPTANYYQNNNITYTAGDVIINYNSTFYDAEIIMYENGSETGIDEGYKYISSDSIKLLAYTPTASNDMGRLRCFKVKLQLKGLDVESYTYEVWIDTRFTSLTITNQNLVDKSQNVVANIALTNDYELKDLIDSNLYGELLTETVNISWTRLNNNYFNYQYQLLEFENNYTANELDTSKDTYTIVPKEKTTGKYVLKVTITDKNGQWIATRIFTINMSTSISGLYKVMDGDKEVEYSSITNLNEILITFGLIVNETDKIEDISVNAMSSQIAQDLGFDSVNEMKVVFTSFGRSTAIPMYISINKLTLHSNSDNGVNCNYYQYTDNSIINLYNITRSNYRTFAIIMQVPKIDINEYILSTDTFALATRENVDDKLLAKGNSFTKYDAEAQYYKLNFNSYNKNMTENNLLERHNKIIIDVYYNGEFASRVIGLDKAITNVEFKNSGIYTLYVRDVAGNVQYFGAGSSRTDYFTLTIMKGILFTINGEAPIKYAYYNDKVVLTINNTNPSTNTYNYDFNTIQLHAYLNNSMNEYKGYTRNAYTYTFSEYGTYLIKMSAKLLSTGETVSGDIVFTILNPNEARIALDFTSICSYDIISIIDVAKTVEKDVTERFLRLLSDKANQENMVYNKLITYERLVEEFGSVQGKMQFKVIYEANDDDLLPARQAEFTFTINNEVPTIESSIGAGKKTTNPVTIKFNGAIIYSQMGECNLVINDEVVLRIDGNSKNEITQLQIKPAGKYYVKIVSDSGYVATSFNFTIKEKLNATSIILIVVISAIVIGLVGTFIWLRTRMKVR